MTERTFLTHEIRHRDYEILKLTDHITAQNLVIEALREERRQLLFQMVELEQKLVRREQQVEYLVSSAP